MLCHPVMRAPPVCVSRRGVVPSCNDQPLCVGQPKGVAPSCIARPLCAGKPKGVALCCIARPPHPPVRGSRRGVAPSCHAQRVAYKPLFHTRTHGRARGPVFHILNHSVCFYISSCCCYSPVFTSCPTFPGMCTPSIYILQCAFMRSPTPFPHQSFMCIRCRTFWRVGQPDPDPGHIHPRAGCVDSTTPSVDVRACVRLCVCNLRFRVSRTNPERYVCFWPIN